MTTRFPKATDFRMGTVLEVGLLTQKADMMVFAVKDGYTYLTPMKLARLENITVARQPNRQVDLMIRSGNWRVKEFRSLTKEQKTAIEIVLHQQYTGIF